MSFENNESKRGFSHTFVGKRIPTTVVDNGNVDANGELKRGYSHAFVGKRVPVFDLFSVDDKRQPQFDHNVDGKRGYSHAFVGKRGYSHAFVGKRGYTHSFVGKRGYNHSFVGKRGYSHAFIGKRSLHYDDVPTEQVKVNGTSSDHVTSSDHEQHLVGDFRTDSKHTESKGIESSKSDDVNNEDSKTVVNAKTEQEPSEADTSNGVSDESSTTQRNSS